MARRLRQLASIYSGSTISKCEGNGYVSQTETHTVNVPKGIQNGATMVLRTTGKGGGEVHIVFKVKDHPFFKREGHDIHTTKSVRLSEAILGANVEVSTLYGKKKISIPPGIQSGDTIKLPGLGVPRLYPNERSKGDHLIHILIRIPTKLNSAQREAILKYAACEDPIQPDDEPKL